MYNHNKLTKELKSIKTEKDAFSVIIKQGDLSWDEIFEGLKLYKEINSQILSKSYYSENKIKELENMGVDFNHVDYLGDNFLLYAYKLKEESSDKKINFYGSVMNYVLPKIENIYIRNNSNKCVLHSMMSWSTSGQKGKDFLNFVEAYPNFDFKNSDKQGKNLLHHALIKNAPIEIVNFLIEKEVNLLAKDNDNNNMLNMFSLSSYTDENIAIFKYFLKIIDVSNKNKWKASCLNDWLEFCTSTGVQNKEMYQKWITELCEEIINKNFTYDQKSIKILQKDMIKHSKNYNKYLDQSFNGEKLKAIYSDAVATVVSISYDYIIPEKKSVQNKLKKIKI